MEFKNLVEYSFKVTGEIESCDKCMFNEYHYCEDYRFCIISNILLDTIPKGSISIYCPLNKKEKDNE